MLGEDFGAVLTREGVSHLRDVEDSIVNVYGRMFDSGIGNVVFAFVRHKILMKRWGGHVFNIKLRQAGVVID